MDDHVHAGLGDNGLQVGDPLLVHAAVLRDAGDRVADQGDFAASAGEGDLESLWVFAAAGAVPFDRIPAGSLPQPAPRTSCRFHSLRYPAGTGSQTRNGLDSIDSVSPTPFEVRETRRWTMGLSPSLNGELDLRYCPELDRPLEDALAAADDASILIDLSGCEFIDSTASP